MKKLLPIILALTMPLLAVAQDSLSRTLNRVTVTSRRPMSEMGLGKTRFDSIALKENIAQSMADVLTYNSGVFVKSYGRATLSTVAFRGTSPSHTKVTWNGLSLNSPMLGMTDFSTIPSYLIDNASLLHGTSSVNETGGGLGGLVKLASSHDLPMGLNMQYTQGVGSFSTFDEFARVQWSNKRWSSSTRVSLSSSPNDYTYINHDKKLNIYDGEHNITGQYHPRERNRSGAFRDLHLLQELWFTPGSERAGRWGLNVWLFNSNRELPLLTTDYSSATAFENRQRETTLRSVASWNRTLRHPRSQAAIGTLDIKGGYVLTRMAYDYRRETSPGNWSDMTRSRSTVNILTGRADLSLTPWQRWMFTANVTLNQQFVRSTDKNITLPGGTPAPIGYDVGRFEASGSLTARWQPIKPLGVALTLRQEVAGEDVAPLIPALFADWQHTFNVASQPLPVTLRASASRNYRFPSINDLYFMPGGNPLLHPERGYTVDYGLTASYPLAARHTLTLTLNRFNSVIDDWILWLPTVKGFFSPRNVKRVNAHGLETRANVSFQLPSHWLLDLHGSWSWTPSINRGEKMSPADKSIGRQLPYVPLHSAALNGRLSWREWAVGYRWCMYTKRYTMSSNDVNITGHLPTYYMNNLSLERTITTRPAILQAKVAINNLFNEDYLSVLARPMPGINFEVFLTITPRLTR